MRHQLRNKDVKELNRQLAVFGIEEFFSKKDKVELLEDKELRMLFRNEQAVLFEHEGRWVPTVKLLLASNFLKKITVDMGAVRFVCNGANIMRPGITNIDEGVAKGDLVSIVDVTHGKCLAVGIALFDAQEMREMSSGIVVRNVHWVGDGVWKING